MPELSQSARNYLSDIATQPAARQPATITEAWDSEWQSGGLGTITGIGRPLRDATDDLRTAIEAASGKPLADYAADHRVLLGAGINVDQHIRALNELADTLPDDAKKVIDPLRDVRRRSMEKAAKIEKDAADVASATYGLAGTATAWAAGIARQTVDPVNLGAMIATAPIGGPVVGRLLPVMARQAAAGAAAQAVVEPYIEPARAELGLESGFKRAAVNVLEAGVGGAVLGAAGVGLHRLFGAAANAYRGSRPAEIGAGISPDVPANEPMAPTVPGAHPNLSAEDFAAAALHAERDAVTGAAPGADPVVHAERVSEAARAMEDGAPLPVENQNIPSLIMDSASLKGQFTDKAGFTDMNAIGDYARAQVKDALDEGKNVAFIIEGKAHKIVEVTNGTMRDDKGQPWGLLPIVMNSPGDAARIEITSNSSRQISRNVAVPEIPAAKPIEPKGPPAEVKEPTEIIGDPALARDLETRLESMPEADDKIFHVEQPDKSIKSGTAKSFMQEIKDNAKAVSELIDCIGKEPT